MMTSSCNQDELLNKLRERAATDLRDFVIMLNGEQNHENILAVGSTIREFMQYTHWWAFENFNEKPNVHNAMDLFWSIYEWWKAEDGSLPASLSDSTEEYDGLILELLDCLYESSKVLYQPDTSDSNNCNKLFIYLHVMAALAFRARKDDELSEEVIDCFNEILRTYARIRSTSTWNAYTGTGSKPPIYVSTHGIIAMSSWEIGRAVRLEGRNEEAFNYLWNAALYYEDALDYTQSIRINDEVDEHDWQSRLGKLLTGLNISLKEASGFFYALKSNREKVKDWKEIVRACDTLSYIRTDAVTGYNELIDDPDSEYGFFEIGWTEFWYSARAWASAQMSRSEYMELREQDKADAAENRLKNYFFGDTWIDVPERAQNALVSADKDFNEKERGRSERILNELRIAVEEICYKFIWKPLEDDKRPSSFDFLNIRTRLSDNPQRSNPDMKQYEYICIQGFFREFLDKHKLGKEDIRFLTKRLPNALSQLRNERNFAEHEGRRPRTRDHIRSFYGGFLGIGQTGVLPELIKIGRKLSSR